MNKGFVQTGIYRCQLCKKNQFPTRISDSDSAATESDDGAEEFEIPVACQGVEACEEPEQKKKVLVINLSLDHGCDENANTNAGARAT